MQERTVVHETIALERELDAPVARVYAAFADQRERLRWDVPEDGWEVAEFSQDFRVGGRELSRFGPKGDPRFYSEGLFLEIDPERRIISAGTMHERDRRMTCTLTSLELRSHAGGTRLFLTDQSAYFGPESSAQRRGGWGQILDNLQRHLAAKE